MTASYNPFFDVDSPLVRRPAPPAPEAHDRIFDQLRTSGPGPTPADASAVRPPTPRASAREVGAQFAHGLGEAGLQAVEMLGRAADVMNPAAAAGVQPGAYSVIHKLLANTRRQMSEYYGEPKTEEEVAFNLLGNLTGSAATGAVGEGVARPVQGILSELRASAAPFRLIPAATPANRVAGFMGNDISEYAMSSPHVYGIIDNSTGKRIGSLAGGLENDGTRFYVDAVSVGEGGVFSTSGKGSLGTRNTREILRQLQEFHPSVREIAGERATGIRAMARASYLAKRTPMDQFPKGLQETTVVPLEPLPEPFPTFRKLPETVRNDLSRIMREERGSFKWGDNPQPTPPQVLKGSDFDELLNRAYFGRPRGPLANPRNIIDPGVPASDAEVVPGVTVNDLLKVNRQMIGEDMALGRMRRRVLKALGDTRTERETRIANNMLRDRIMANEDLLKPTGRTLSEAVKPVSIFDFLKGLSRQ